MQVKATIEKEFDVARLNKLKQDGFIVIQKHPSLDLFIYNYSQQTQWSNTWEDYTLQCRGLVLDGDGKVIARPFPKFFNYSQVEKELPIGEEFEVFEKMDGSLLITFLYKGEQIFATRGSFTSEQAIKAKEIWQKNNIDFKNELVEGQTYLFEILYPENRIVVDYHGKEDLIALSVIDNATGKEIPHEVLQTMFPSVVKKYNFDEKKKIEELFAEEKPNSEGFVVRFKSGFRCKVKFAEYCRLHKIMTGISNKNIWEFLKAGSDLNEVIKNVPDEVFDWFKKVESDLRLDYKSIKVMCDAIVKQVPEGDRKTKAAFITKHKYPHILFSMIDNRDYSSAIWDLVKPKYCKPFKKDEEG
jgi:T4 RnlA family RNA ligase